MEVWLIQRGTVQYREGSKGIDSLVRFDYMGSAEFEWGALPKSLKRIREELNDYTYLDIPIKERVVTVFCKNSQKSEMKQYLTDLAERKFRLKEFAAFNEFVNDSGYFKDRFNFWWDIENDLMFWKKDNEFELKFKIKIDVY